MKILGMDAYGVYLKIDRCIYPKLVKALAELDDDDSKEN